MCNKPRSTKFNKYLIETDDETEYAKEIVKEKMDTIPKGLLVTYYDTESFFRGQKPLGFVKPIMHQLKAKFLVQPEQQKN